MFEQHTPEELFAELVEKLFVIQRERELGQELPLDIQRHLKMERIERVKEREMEIALKRERLNPNNNNSNNNRAITNDTGWSMD